MSKAAIVGVVIGIGVIGGGGYYYMSNKANQELHNTINLIEKSMPGSSLKYETSSVSPFSQSATLGKVVFKDAQGREYIADTLTMSGVSKDKVGKISLDKFHTTVEDGTIDIAHIDASNVVAAAGAILIEDGKIKRVFPSKVSFDLLNLQNINAVGPNKRDTFTVGQYEVKNYGENRKSDQLIKQVVIKPNANDQEYLKLNQAQIDGLNLAQMIAATEQGQTPQVIPGQPQKGTLDGLEFQGEGRTWSLVKFETENSVDQNGNQKSSAVFSGFKMNTDHNVKLYTLKKIGYDQLDASGKLTGSYNKAKQQWSFAPFELTIKDMGVLNANLEFNGPENLSNIDPDKLMSDYKLISLKVTLQNQGLLQKIFDKTAKEQNISADQVKQKTIDMIKQDAEKAVLPVQKQGDEAIVELINDPKKSLVIDMKPATPMSFVELAGDSPLSMVGKLNLNVKAEAVK